MRKLLFLLIFFASLFTTQEFAESAITKDKVTSFLSSLKKQAITGKKMELMSNDILSKIREECCAESFQSKPRLLEIQDSIELCLSNKCHKKGISLMIKKSRKLEVLNQIDEAKDLLYANLKVSYEDSLIKERKRAEIAIQKNQNLENKFNLLTDENKKKLTLKENSINEIKSQFIEEISKNDKLSSLIEQYEKQINELNDLQKKISSDNEYRINELTVLHNKELEQNNKLTKNFDDLKNKFEARNNELNETIISLNEQIIENEKIINEMYEDVTWGKKSEWKEKIGKE